MKFTYDVYRYIQYTTIKALICSIPPLPFIFLQSSPLSTVVLQIKYMVINAKKTFCLRVGRRASVICANIVTLNGIALQWSDELRYLGVYIVRSFRFKISLDKPKRSFCVLRTVSLVKLGVLPLKKLLYSYLIVNVFLYCFMHLKPARLVSRI